MVDVVGIKILFLFLILLTAGAAGFFPLFTPAFHRNKNWLSIGNCFAAGIFIIVGLAGLLPEAQESFDDSLPDPMPLAYVLAVIGYLVILFVEKIVFTHSHDTEGIHSHNFSLNSNSLINSFDEKDHAKAKIDMSALVPAIILTAALVIHSTFEGIAVGLLSSKSKAITLSSAVMIHNIPAAVALGIKMELLEKWIYITLMTCFVLSSPLSIAIGIFLSTIGSPAIQGVFLSISAGTFVYIGCSEILPEEMEKPGNKFVKFLAFSLGCLPLAMFFLFVPEE